MPGILRVEERVNDSLEGFFDRYAAAFDAYDVDAIVGFFHLPCLLVERDRAVSLTSGAAVRRNIEAILRHHRESGYARASVGDVSVLTRSEGLAIVLTRWRVHRDDDSVLWEWSNSYNLLGEGDARKIVVSTTL